MGYKIIIFHDLLFLYIDRKPSVSSLRCYTAYKNPLSGFKVISSLTTRSRQKFGKKREANFIVYLISNLPRFRNSCRDVYRQHIVENQRLGFPLSVKIMCVNYVDLIVGIISTALFVPATCPIKGYQYVSFLMKVSTRLTSVFDPVPLINGTPYR